MKNHTVGLRKTKVLPPYRRKKTSRLVWILFLALSVGAGGLFLLGSANAMGTRSAPEFVKKAAVGNSFEVEAGELALERSQDENVRNFAQHMIDDHGAAGEKLAAAAQQANIDSPDQALDDKHRKMLNKLRQKQGIAFDRAYIHSQVKAHDEAVSLFKNYANKGEDGPVKQFAADTLPTLEKHKEKINQMQATYSK